MSITGISPVSQDHNHDFAAYDEFLLRLKQNFTEQTNDPTISIFTTDADHLFDDVFLPNLPAMDRQIYKCHACQHFMKAYGGLVTIDDRGDTRSLFWSVEAPEYFQSAVEALCSIVEQAKITGVFLSSNNKWGVSVTGQWTHFAVTPPSSIIYRKSFKTASQMMAEKLEDFRNMGRALQEYSLAHVTTAITLLESEALYRSEKVLGVAKWLKSVYDQRDRTKNTTQRTNILWRMVASAPNGFCHPRGSMIGTLLDDLRFGLSFEQVERRFRIKMDPLMYQRPQVAPAAQNIKRAEEIVAHLGIAESLKRRYARLDEVQTIWQPKATDVSGNGVFSHIRPKGVVETPNMEAPSDTFTVEKFRRTILPKADRIEVLAPSVGNFTALVTALDLNSPPILQWDRDDMRNPVSAYVYNPMSAAATWGLSPNRYHKVNAISLVPSMWNDGKLGHFSTGIIVIIDGARDSNWRSAGLGLFPETLKAELREVRATIEAHSLSAHITGYEDSSACGIVLTTGKSRPLMIRVTTGDLTMNIRLDRWD